MDRADCPITRTLKVIGGKWKPVILHYLELGPCRTGELGRLIPRVSGKMLTQQLRELERDGIVRRKVYHQVPPKVEYGLTPLGKTLGPILDAMCAWAEAHPPASQGPSKRAADPARGPRRAQLVG